MLSIILGIILGILVYYKLIKASRYWSEKDIAYEPGWPIIGNMIDFVTKRKHFLEITKDIYRKYPNDRYVGYTQFGTPALLIRDLDLIKQIGVKQFDHFHDHMGIVSKDLDPILSQGLINLLGDQWKRMRATLSPAFTSSKIRNMYHLMTDCAENFVSHHHGKTPVAVEMKDVFSRFANDVIATAAFGMQINSIKESNNEFFLMGKKITDLNASKAMKLFLSQLSTKLSKLFNIRMLDEDVATFFQSVILENVRKRSNEGIVRQDLIHLLMEAQKGRLKHDDQHGKGEGFASVEESHIGKDTRRTDLTDEDIVAQALMFFFAGYDTISTASSLMAHELAVNPEIQQKLQEEIDAVRKQYVGKVPYEALISMKYLDQVVSESLRMWPPSFQTDRLCNQDCTIPPKNPNERTFVVEKGVLVVIPIMAVQRDPRYFPDPDRFDPERFSDENKSKIVPGSYLPFGIGPRNCIGSRFALLEMKTLFFYLLSKFDLVPNDKTEIPIKISPKKVNMSPENGFQLTLKPRKLI